jgi:hypothetical protein
MSNRYSTTCHIFWKILEFLRRFYDPCLDLLALSVSSAKDGTQKPQMKMFIGVKPDYLRRTAGSPDISAEDNNPGVVSFMIK